MFTPVAVAAALAAAAAALEAAALEAAALAGAAAAIAVATAALAGAAPAAATASTKNDTFSSIALSNRLCSCDLSSIVIAVTRLVLFGGDGYVRRLCSHQYNCCASVKGLFIK